MNDDIKPYFVKLPLRGLVHVEGEDRVDFLNNLVTNDVSHAATGAATGASLYACLLTPQGKFLHDFFMLAGDGFILLDCEGGDRTDDLYRRLNMYRLRAKIAISAEDGSQVFAGFGPPPPGALPDPRHPDMGWRSFEKPTGIEERPFEDWDRRRIMLQVPDGSRDMVPEKSTMLESGIDRLNGVSFTKGCYVGQELTARMHHRGLAKKHLYAISGADLPAPGADIEIGGVLAGEMRSRAGDVGLALLKDEIAAAQDGQVAPFRIIC